jgi:hypothetical protein
VFFRAGHAMARPRNGFQAFLLKFLFALDARSVCICLDAFQRFVDQRQHGPVGISLPEQEFLGVGVRGLIRKIHRRIVIRGPAFFLGSGNGLDQFLAPSLQLFFVIIQTLLIHGRAPLFTHCRYHKRVIVGPLFTTVKEGWAPIGGSAGILYGTVI